MAAREAAAEVSAEVKALADKLATNDFPHVEGGGAGTRTRHQSDLRRASAIPDLP